jgi:hypothetical protein
VRIKPKSKIGGIPATLVKRLCRLERFSTPAAAWELKLLEPEISSVLAALQREGYLSFCGQDPPFMDRWEVTGLGSRLAATRIGAPITRDRADQTVDQLIAAARNVNADDLAYNVERLLVFGSWVNGTEELGDIDVVADLRKRVIEGRDLERESRRRLRARKQQAHLLEDLGYPTTEVYRRLRDVSPYVSLHAIDDIHAYAAPYRIIYAFDAERRIELPASGEILRGDPARTPMQAQTDEPIGSSTSRACNEPQLPPPPSRNDMRRPRRFGDRANFVASPKEIEAMHMWANGASAEEICAHLCRPYRTTPRSVRDLVNRLYGYAWAIADAEQRGSDRSSISLDIGGYVAAEKNTLRRDASGYFIDHRGWPVLSTRLYTGSRSGPNPSIKAIRLRHHAALLDAIRPILAADGRSVSACISVSSPNFLSGRGWRIKVRLYEDDADTQLAETESNANGSPQRIAAASNADAETVHAMHRAARSWAERTWSALGPGIGFDGDFFVDIDALGGAPVKLDAAALDGTHLRSVATSACLAEQRIIDKLEPDQVIVAAAHPKERFARGEIRPDDLTVRLLRVSRVGEEAARSQGDWDWELMGTKGFGAVYPSVIGRILTAAQQWFSTNAAMLTGFERFWLLVVVDVEGKS